jgi:hypothetical protein
VVKLQKHLLTDGARIRDRVAAELRGPGYEPALRRRHGDRAADEISLELSSDAVN